MTATVTKPPGKKPEAEKTEEKGGGGRKKLIVLLAAVLLAAGAGAYFFLFSGSGEPAPPEPGAVVALDPVAVNLSGGGYLKVAVALQMTADAGKEKVDGAKAQDLVISTYSLAKPADVNGAREALKKSLEKKIVEAYEGEVMAIYFTEYVTQ